jgi:hypothetical protein
MRSSSGRGSIVQPAVGPRERWGLISSTCGALALLVIVVLAGTCGGGSNAPPTVPTSSTPAPTPIPTPTPPVNDFSIVSTDPPLGGVIQTGVSPNGVTTAFRLTLSVASNADRQANVQVFLEGPQNGVCLEDTAPDKRPSAPDVDLKAGVPVTLTIDTWRVTSVCFYPNHVTTLTARMMPSPDILATPIYVKHFAVDYSVTR